MDHAVDALREAGEGFLLNLTTSNGHALEAMGRAIGGQPLCGFANSVDCGGNLLKRTSAQGAAEETEMLRVS